MGVPQKSVAYIEIEDYLALENASQYKHEYLDGVIYAIQGEPFRGMAGGTATHADIIRNLGFALHSQLRGTPCAVKMSDMRLRIADDAIFYPDVLVHCQPTPQPSTTTELTDARLVAEVLSPTTQHFDRGAKLQAYQKLPGLQHVLLLSGMEQAAWVCHRSAEGPWGELMPWPRGSQLHLPSLKVTLGWNEVYEGVGLG
jgi:Uma2 family endonuclease